MGKALKEGEKRLRKEIHGLEKQLRRQVQANIKELEELVEKIKELESATGQFVQLYNTIRSDPL